jgi:hypothetical protein
MNKVKLLSATAMLVAALAAPGFAQDRGGGGAAGAGAGVSGPGGGGSAGGGAAVSGPGGGGSAGGGAAVSGPGGGGSAGGRAAVSGGASQGRSFGGNAAAPSARGEFSGGGMRTGSAQIGAGGTVRGGSDRTFATNRGDWRGGGWHHHRHGGRFVVGGYNSYAYGDCYVVRKRVLTPYGWRVRRAQVCN